ncbi:hypothetical protein [Pseudomonas sp. NMI542_15]|uniref:hypothetical protein n=1 Tax=Pseudomonas sp. NMI542_15 TaxID=2903148 RepID=UPI001E5EA18D|nr:hypothetical protein [Pseudomonas sp. NMI542_15]MCE0782875.1 hypothetical protein [Pseudomonas sp. NMI542_15]
MGTFALNSPSVFDLESRLQQAVQAVKGEAYSVVYWPTSAGKHGFAILRDGVDEQCSCELRPSTKVEAQAFAFVQRYLQ